ncbi:MAG: nucleotide exchange factor GrpE [Eubacteriales bacterium]|nr:nucleotide exchange factor GrpE [Eubacteriales bacterium]
MTEENKETLQEEKVKTNPTEERNTEETVAKAANETPEETAASKETAGASEDAAVENEPAEETPDQRFEALTDRYQRLMAEFENFRKRSNKEKSEMFDNGVSSLILKILPVVDNFERGLEAVDEDKRDDSFYQGFEQIYKQFMEVLEGIDVRPIEALGRAFDPDFHNAVLHEEDEHYGENEITEEFQKGYTYKDKVIRYSMVKVVN